MNIAFHLNAFQAPPREELDLSEITLLYHYANLITKNAIEFKKLSLYTVADAYFSRMPFVSAVSSAKMFY